jgi:hypothetical protein
LADKSIITGTKSIKKARITQAYFIFYDLIHIFYGFMVSVAVLDLVLLFFLVVAGCLVVTESVLCVEDCVVRLLFKIVSVLVLAFLVVLGVSCAETVPTKRSRANVINKFFINLDF